MTAIAKTIDTFSEMAAARSVIEFRYGYKNPELRCGRVIEQVNAACNKSGREIITVEMFGMGGGYRTFYCDKLEVC